MYPPSSFEAPQGHNVIELEKGCPVEMSAVSGFTESFEFVKKRKEK